jgi:hypothetical protein
MRIQSFIIALAMTGCAFDDTEPELETGEVESESSVHQWQLRGALNQKSEWQVGMAYYGGRLQMVHNGHGTPSELWSTYFDGTRWSTNVKLTQRSTGGPALFVHGGQLKMVYRASGQNRLMMSTFNGSTYGTPITIGSLLGYEQIKSEPTAAVYGGQLYVGYCTNGSIRVDRFNGAQWSLVYQNVLSSSASCEHVELAVIPDTGQLHFEVASIWDPGYGDPSHTIYETRTSNGTSWTAPAILQNKKTKQPMSIVSCGGVTHLTHGGYSNASEIWWSERINGAWYHDYRLPGHQSWGGAALGCYGTRAIMVHNGLYGDLQWLEFGL